MAPDRPILTAEKALRLLDDVERIPQRPVGPHLDEEDFVGLTIDSLNASRKQAALEHIQSCAQCAEDAVNAPGTLEKAAEVRRRSVERRAHARPPLNRTPSATGAADPRLAQLVWIAAAAVWVAARRASFRARGVTATKRTVGGKRRPVEGSFECAIAMQGGARILAVRTMDREWTGKPIRCAIRETGKARVDVWLILPTESHNGEHVGTVRLKGGGRRLPRWTAAIEVHESFEQLPRDRVRLLRRAFMAAGGNAERDAWRTWLGERVRAGEMTTGQAAKITGL